MPENTWLLPESLQVQDVAHELVRLRAVFDSRLPVTLDVSRLAAVDTAGVQLLAALVREGRRLHIPVALQGDCAVLSRALELLGFPQRLAGLGDT